MRIHPIRRKILRSFSREKALSFTQLERASGVRSNHASYHLTTLVNEGILRRTTKGYTLTASGQRLLVALGSLAPAELPLPVILVAASKNKHIAFIRRTERPYTGRLGLPGGRLRFGETLAEAAIRIAREKAWLEVRPKDIGGIAVEHLVARDGLAHGFLLVLVHANVIAAQRAGAVRWHNQKRLPSTIIPSDAQLLRSKGRLPLISFDIPEGRKGF